MNFQEKTKPKRKLYDKKRNKFNILLIVILAVSLFMVNACADSKTGAESIDDGIIGWRLSSFFENLESGRWDVIVCVLYDDRAPYIQIRNKSNYVFPEDVALKINDVDIKLSYYFWYDEHDDYRLWEFYEGYYPFINGEINKFTLTYAGRTHVVNLRHVSRATITSTIPSQFDLTLPFTINWEKNFNTDIQPAFPINSITMLSD